VKHNLRKSIWIFVCIGCVAIVAFSVVSIFRQDHSRNSAAKKRQDIATVTGVYWMCSIDIEALVMQHRSSLDPPPPGALNVVSKTEGRVGQQKETGRTIITRRVSDGMVVGTRPEIQPAITTQTRHDYDIMDFKVVRLEKCEGGFDTPHWPIVGSLDSRVKEREGKRIDVYRVALAVKGFDKELTFRPKTAEAFAPFKKGSRWLVEWNRNGHVAVLRAAD